MGSAGFLRALEATWAPNRLVEKVGLDRIGTSDVCLAYALHLKRPQMSAYDVKDVVAVL